MKKVASVFLRPEITPDDIQNLYCWLCNQHITKYLNEDASTPAALKSLLYSTPAPMLSYHFNSQGRFFLVCDDYDESIGFVRFRECTSDCFELVFAIGKEELWGNGYGSQAVRTALSKAFFEWRAKKLIARVYHDNTRSVRIIRHCGFSEEQRFDKLSQYAITINGYLKTLNQNKLA